MGSLDAKRIIVLGAATPIGAAACAAFEVAGATVAAAGADDDGDATVAIDQAISALGGLDVLANLTAPDAAPMPSAEITHDEWERTFVATVRTARTSNQAAIRHMSDHSGGMVINLADQSAETGLSQQALRAAAAQAVVAYTNATSGVLRGGNVHINVLQPGSQSDPMAHVAPALVYLAGSQLHGRTFPC